MSSRKTVVLVGLSVAAVLLFLGMEGLGEDRDRTPDLENGDGDAPTVDFDAHRVSVETSQTHVNEPLVTVSNHGDVDFTDIDVDLDRPRDTGVAVARREFVDTIEAGSQATVLADVDCPAEPEEVTVTVAIEVGDAPDASGERDVEVRCEDR